MKTMNITRTESDNRGISEYLRQFKAEGYLTNPDSNKMPVYSGEKIDSNQTVKYRFEVTGGLNNTATEIGELEKKLESEMGIFGGRPIFPSESYSSALFKLESLSAQLKIQYRISKSASLEDSKQTAQIEELKKIVDSIQKKYSSFISL